MLWPRPFVAAGACMLDLFPRRCPGCQSPSPAAILQDLHNFDTMGSVLYVAAHPDDENTQLITYLARGRHYRTAYLSLTRGDGGQNVLGPEFGAELGVIRTEELLAARRLDGGEQFFTRAMDFGFSKDYRETLRIWDQQEVLSDVVRVIRTFQPDVVIAGFSTNQTPGQHGHHVASAILAGEAFKLAGDPKAFPDQLDYLTPWQPKRLLQRPAASAVEAAAAPPPPGRMSKSAATIRCWEFLSLKSPRAAAPCTRPRASAISAASAAAAAPHVKFYRARRRAGDQRHHGWH